ncbi:hypothetical protein [Vibrio diabolicus]|uniref:hypothetical protein n=1 Tax=Vibrio diabolicus TaxID=50719 RepID=UPI003D7D5D58
MKRMYLVLSALVSFSTVAETSKLPTDPFDLSASTQQVGELGVITKADVDQLEERSRALFNDGKCKEAIPVLVEYSKKANWLANMISASLDPYYGASYDDRKAFPYEKIKPLIPLENMSNEYKSKRDIAFAMQGECLIKTGNKEAAIPVLLKTLDLLSIDNEVWWKRTRNNLLDIIGVSE